MPTPRKHTNAAAKQKAYRERMKYAREQELSQKGLPPIPAIPTMPGTARWKALHVQAIESLSLVQQEMREYSQNRSEAWKRSDKGLLHSMHLYRIGIVLNVLKGIEGQQIEGSTSERFGSTELATADGPELQNLASAKGR